MVVCNLNSHINNTLYPDLNLNLFQFVFTSQYKHYPFLIFFIHIKLYAYTVPSWCPDSLDRTKTDPDKELAHGSCVTKSASCFLSKALAFCELNARMAMTWWCLVISISVDAAGTGATFSSSLPTKAQKRITQQPRRALRSGERAPACIFEKAHLFFYTCRLSHSNTNIFGAYIFISHYTWRQIHTVGAVAFTREHTHFSNNNFYSHNGTKKVALRTAC